MAVEGSVRNGSVSQVFGFQHAPTQTLQNLEVGRDYLFQKSRLEELNFSGDVQMRLRQPVSSS